MLSIAVSGTGSSQTVFQIPETAVYQMDLGLRTCLPCCCQDASVGSQTATTNSFSPSTRWDVISKLNGRYPPVCLPISSPFTQTVASQSTAPKCSKTRFSCHFSGMVKVL